MAYMAETQGEKKMKKKMKSSFMIFFSPGTCIDGASSFSSLFLGLGRVKRPARNQVELFFVPGSWTSHETHEQRTQRGSAIYMHVSGEKKNMNEIVFIFLWSPWVSAIYTDNCRQ